MLSAALCSGTASTDDASYGCQILLKLIKLYYSAKRFCAYIYACFFFFLLRRFHAATSANLCGYIARHKFSFHLKIRDAKSEKVWCAQKRTVGTYVGYVPWRKKPDVNEVCGQVEYCSDFRTHHKLLQFPKENRDTCAYFRRWEFSLLRKCPRVIVVEVEKAKVCLTLRNAQVEFPSLRNIV